MNVSSRTRYLCPYVKVHVSWRLVECVLKSNCVCPHVTVRVSLRSHTCVLTTTIMCPHVHVTSILTSRCMCPYDCYHVSTRTCNVYPYVKMHVSLRSNECVLKSRVVCPYGNTHVSSCRYAHISRLYILYQQSGCHVSSRSQNMRTHDINACVLMLFCVYQQHTCHIFCVYPHAFLRLSPTGQRLSSSLFASISSVYQHVLSGIFYPQGILRLSATPILREEECHTADRCKMSCVLTHLVHLSAPWSLWCH